MEIVAGLTLAFSLIAVLVRRRMRVEDAGRPYPLRTRIAARLDPASVGEWARCECGCPARDHQHLRDGFDCGRCGVQFCVTFRLAPPSKQPVN